MGTRSLTVIKDGRKEICTLYRQMDGYPEGHGKELSEFLSGFRVVNGYSSMDTDKVANGISCLAAQVIAHFKDGVGMFYLYPPGSRDMDEEYIYVVDVVNGNVRLVIKEVVCGAEVSKPLVTGSPECVLAWIRTLEEA